MKKLNPNQQVKMVLLRKPCVFCDNSTSIEDGIMSCDEEGNHVKTLCNQCILFHTGVYLRGQYEFELAKRVEAYLKSRST
jgi:hypothetical protein